MRETTAALLADLRALLAERGLPVGTVRPWKSGEHVKLKSGEWAPTEKSRRKLPLRKPLEDLERISAAVANLQTVIAKGKLKKETSLGDHVRIAKEQIHKHREGRKAALDHLQQVMEGVTPVSVSARTKGLGSTLGKLAAKPEYYPTAAAMDDLTGMRVVVKTLDEVKKVSAALKKQYRPGDGESWEEGRNYDDYTARPKQTGYRSHHLSVLDSDGLVKEVQVRTENQDEWAVWAHHVYKPENQEELEALGRHERELAEYARQMSEHFAAVDRGVTQPPPPCPEVIKKSPFGCIGEKR